MYNVNDKEGKRLDADGDGEMLCPADEVKRNAAVNCQSSEAGGDEW